MGLKDKVTEIATDAAQQVVNQIVTRQNQVQAQDGLGQISALYLDKDGNRLATVNDGKGGSFQVTIASSRVLGIGDTVIVNGGQIAQ